MQPLEEVHTPNVPGIEDVCAFLKIQPAQMIKTLVYEIVMSTPGTPPVGFVVVCVRGDHEVNENKLKRLCPGQNLVLAEPKVAESAGFAIGYVGPHIANGKPLTLIIDPDARALINAVTGANRHDYHVKGFNWTRDVTPHAMEKSMVADVRNVVEGDIAPGGTNSKLTFRKAIEVGHVFKLGTKYTDAMGATYLDENGQPHSIIMGCYGIGLNRILAAAIESHHDGDGILWPMTIAPFHVLIAALDVRDEEVMGTARQIHDALESQGVEVLLDDRDHRPGFKFKDADLIGLPLRITIGRKGLNDGMVELKLRNSKDVEKLASQLVIERAASIVKQR